MVVAMPNSLNEILAQDCAACRKRVSELEAALTKAAKCFERISSAAPGVLFNLVDPQTEADRAWATVASVDAPTS